MATKRRRTIQQPKKREGAIPEVPPAVNVFAEVYSTVARESHAATEWLEKAGFKGFPEQTQDTQNTEVEHPTRHNRPQH